MTTINELRQRLALRSDDWDKDEAEIEGRKSGVSPRKDTHIGKPGMTRKERLEKTKEYEEFMKENPDATEKMLDENLIYTPHDVLRFDEEFAKGIPKPRVEGFSPFLPRKITGRVTERGENYGKFQVSGEPVNVDEDTTSSRRRGESVLSDKLEDRRVDKTLLKKRGEEESFSEHFIRKYGPQGLDKPAGEELKVDEFSQAVISGPNAKRWAKLKTRLARIYYES